MVVGMPTLAEIAADPARIARLDGRRHDPASSRPRQVPAVRAHDPARGQGKLFLHTDRGWRSGPKGVTDVGDHCPAGMTTDFDPVAADAVKAAS